MFNNIHFTVVMHISVIVMMMIEHKITDDNSLRKPYKEDTDYKSDSDNTNSSSSTSVTDENATTECCFKS